MTYHFVLIDDEDERRVQSFAQTLQAADASLKIECFRPESFEEQLSRLKRADEQFGVILDNRLDERSPSVGTPPRAYRGLTVAQEIRNRATDDQAWLQWTYPIILLSMQERLERFYKPDSTGHDLFDAIYAKEDVSRQSEQIARELASLVNGYGTLRQSRCQAQIGEIRLRALLGTNIAHQRLDLRVQEALLGGGVHPCHVDAQFILQKLLGRPGLLINEALLAARLGVDRQNSPQWGELLKILDALRYQGVFSEGWERWWARDLESWWRNLSSRPRAMPMLEAEERVKVLRQDLSLEGLFAAEPIQKSYSTRYWTVCSATKRPLDRADAVRISESEPEPWQEARYLSLVEALQGVGDFDIHRLDKERVETLRHEAGEDE